jgi:hypothetical protein
VNHRTVFERHARHHAPIELNGRRLAFDHSKIRNSTQVTLDPTLVELSIRLRPRRSCRGAPTAVQHTKLNTSGVDGPSHQSAERVELFYEVPLSDAADRWIARHLPDPISS